MRAVRDRGIMIGMEAAGVVASLSQARGGPQLLEAAAGRPGIWLVGGAVRDLLLGIEPRELDVLVEDDLEALAQQLGEPTFHDRFGTATVRGDGFVIDLAAPRTESYAAPGALPEVGPATVQEDLRRRDFTVNAIAVSLADGEVACDPRAFDDLGAGVLRVLHEGSFADDPTRVWRMARYAGRLGFTPDARTAELAAQATPGEASGERVGNELRLVLCEDDPCAALEALARYSPQVLPPEFIHRPDGLEDATALLPEEGRRDLLVLAACTAGMDVGALARWLDELAFTAADRDLVLACSRWVTGAPLRTAEGPVAVARAARGAPLEAIALAGGANASLWLEELRHVELEIDGDDLLAAGLEPGPQLGEALQRALDAKLAGLCEGREAELAAALAAGPKSK